jgi:hypothetical protein
MAGSRKVSKGFRGNNKETEVSRFRSLKEKQQETNSVDEFDAELKEYLCRLSDNRKPSMAAVYMSEKIFRGAVSAVPDLLSLHEIIYFLTYNKRRNLASHQRAKELTAEEIEEATATLNRLIEAGAILKAPGSPALYHLKGANPFNY